MNEPTLIMHLDYMMFDRVLLSIAFAVLLGITSPVTNYDDMPY